MAELKRHMDVLERVLEDLTQRPQLPKSGLHQYRVNHPCQHDPVNHVRPHAHGV